LKAFFAAAAPKHLARRLAQRIAPCVRDEQAQQGLVGEPGLNLVVVPAPVNINASTYKPMDLNRDWSARFSTLRDKNGWVRTKRFGSNPAVSTFKRAGKTGRPLIGRSRYSGSSCFSQSSSAKSLTTFVFFFLFWTIWPSSAPVVALLITLIIDYIDD